MEWDLERRVTRGEVRTGAPDGVPALGDRLVMPAIVSPETPSVPPGRVTRDQQDLAANFRNRQGQQIVDPPFFSSSSVMVWRMTAR